MKISFANILRPLIFFICGLGYLPLQSADSSGVKNFSSVELHSNNKNSDELNNQSDKNSISHHHRDKASTTSKENKLN